MKKTPIGLVIIVLFLQVFALMGCKKEGEEYARTLMKTLDMKKILATRNSMDKIAFSLNRYMIDYGHYPVGEDLGSVEFDLVPSYIGNIPMMDAWGNEFHYTSDGLHFTLTSDGDDSVENSSDDIIMTDGSYL